MLAELGSTRVRMGVRLHFCSLIYVIESEVVVAMAYLHSDRRQHSPAERTRASMAFLSEGGVLSLSFLSPLDV
jgi:hypothetical protein